MDALFFFSKLKFRAYNSESTLSNFSDSNGHTFCVTSSMTNCQRRFLSFVCLKIAKRFLPTQPFTEFGESYKNVQMSLTTKCKNTGKECPVRVRFEQVLQVTHSGGTL